MTVRPKSLKIPVEIVGDTAILHLPGPCKLLVEVNDCSPLAVFANPPSLPAPATEAPNIRVFGPGISKPGAMTLKDNEQVYLAPGALVYGTIRCNVRNVRIFGEGILDGSQTRGSLVSMRGAKNVEIEGICLRFGSGWQNTLTNSDNVTYRNVKVFSGAIMVTALTRYAAATSPSITASSTVVTIALPSKVSVMVSVRMWPISWYRIAFSVDESLVMA